MKILGQIISIQPLALILSLPNQLLGHVPITKISTQLTSLLEGLNDDDETSGLEDGDDGEDGNDSQEDRDSKPPVPTLFDLFHTGQYVRALVTTIHDHASAAITGIGNTRDEIVKASRKVELSLLPEEVNAGVQKSDLRFGFVSLIFPVHIFFGNKSNMRQTLSAVVKSIEDHGFILELGVPDVSGFLSFKDLQKGPEGNERRLQVGQLVDVVVKKMSSNGRTCNVTFNSNLFASSTVRPTST
jgi:rRNA biogenesis protein RRP5